MGKKNVQGFTLTELMIAIAVIAIIASIALPGFLSSRLSANESAAISTLKAIASAQAQVQVATAIDSDGDGAGEYAYLGELAGLSPARISVAGVPQVGALNVDELDPTIVSAALGNVQADGNGDGVVTRSGYVFKMFLPGPSAGGITPAVPEDAGGGATVGGLPDPNNCELLWSCYAWPVDAARTGSRTFFMNQDGELTAFANRGGVYSGIVTPASIPAFDAALSAAAAGSMTSPVALNGVVSNDGNLWTTLQ